MTLCGQQTLQVYTLGPDPKRTMREPCAYCGAQPGEACHPRNSYKFLREFHKIRVKHASYKP